MRDSFETQCQELRTQIARSRRRLDHGISQWVNQASGWLHLGRTVFTRSRTRTPMIIAALGWGWLRWRAWTSHRRASTSDSLESQNAESNPDSSADSRLVNFLVNWSRICRIWAWRLNRPTVDREQERSDD